MKWRMGIVSLLVWVSLVAAEEPGKVSNKDGKFEIVFPKKPTTENRQKALIWMVEEGDQGIYFLSLKKHPMKLNIDEKADIKNRFDGAQANILSSLRGTLLKSVDGTLGDKKTPIRDIDISLKGKGIYRLRYVATDEHFYQIMVGGSKEWVDAPPALEFIKSFKVVEGK